MDKSFSDATYCGVDTPVRGGALPVMDWTLELMDGRPCQSRASTLVHLDG